MDDQTIALSEADSASLRQSAEAGNSHSKEGVESPLHALNHTAAGPPPAGSGSYPSESSLSSSSFFNHGRFVPGTMVANRYRIVAMIGRGGMGEVYRADDLKLGQTVALKFLPPGVATDSAAVTRLHTEVRLAREIAHPNVCRVYDVGDINGQPFLSMQYVDGENLATLLRRIDRLPHEKAIDLVRQLVTGLAAAHDRGVLHRDLKPANLMLDDRGKLIITDFGLSVVIDAAPADPSIVGTPAYMAPEQLAGQPTTVRSDLYSLGLLIYELFTGRPVFKAHSYEELLRQRQEFDPGTLSDAMERVEVDPVLQRIVLRCTEPDPLRRPARALAVLAALPGGDPLAAALAAGETPTPEMVAAAGGAGGLRYRRALALFAAVLLPILVMAMLNAALSARHPPVPSDEDPTILADYARQTLRTLSDPATIESHSAFSVWGIEWDPGYFAAQRAASESSTESRRAGGLFWYRQSPRRFVPTFPSLPVTLNDPPAHIPGMTSAVFGPGRQLLRYSVVGPIFVAGAAPGTSGAAAAVPASPWIDAATSAGLIPSSAGSSPNWAPLLRLAANKLGDKTWHPFFEKARIDPLELRSAVPVMNPPVSSDRRFAWTIHPKNEAPASAPVRIEAATLAGKPVYFALLRPWEVPVATAADSSPVAATGARSAFDRTFDFFGFFVRWAIWFVAAALAINNARAGRSDRRNAFRLGLAVFGLYSASMLLRAAHQPPSVTESSVIFNCLAQGLLRGGMAWLFYLALEPYVRRAWPDWLISWTRLLSGQWRDPLVGRDLLGGFAIAAIAALLLSGATLVYTKLGGVMPAPTAAESGDALRSTRHALAGLFSGLSIAAISAAAFPFIAAAVLGLTGSRRAVIPVAGAVLFLVMFHPSANLPVTAVSVAIMVGARLLAMVKFGALGLAACAFGAFVFQNFPPTFDLTPWYATAVWTVTALLIAIALHAFRAATRGQPFFHEEALG